MKRALLAIWGFGLAMAGTGAMAADIASGKAKATAVCAVCHGPQGIATLPDAPNLAGQSPIYLSEQLKNYRSGKRTHEVMSLMAKPLTDQEIEDMSAWYSSQQIVLRTGG